MLSLLYTLCKRHWEYWSLCTLRPCLAIIIKNDQGAAWLSSLREMTNKAVLVRQSASSTTGDNRRRPHKSALRRGRETWLQGGRARAAAIRTRDRPADSISWLRLHVVCYGFSHHWLDGCAQVICCVLSFCPAELKNWWMIRIMSILLMYYIE